MVPKPDPKKIVVVPVQKVKPHAQATRDNFHTRANEAIFLVIVGLVIEPVVHETFHFVGTILWTVKQ